MFSQDLATMTQSKTLLAKADWSTSKVPAAVASTSSTESLPFAIPIGDRRHSTVCTTHACSVRPASSSTAVHWGRILKFLTNVHVI